jgi:hypothetical protein
MRCLVIWHRLHRQSLTADAVIQLYIRLEALVGVSGQPILQVLCVRILRDPWP